MRRPGVDISSEVVELVHVPRHHRSATTTHATMRSALVLAILPTLYCFTLGSTPKAPLAARVSSASSPRPAVADLVADARDEGEGVAREAAERQQD